MFARLTLLCSPLIVLGFSAPLASAAPLFSDNFNGEAGASPSTLNYSSFANFTVSGGTVDLIGSGSVGTSFDFLPGNGLYVDLDGSTNQAGLLSTNLVFAPGTYELSFSLAGNQRGAGSDTVVVTLGSFTQSFTLGQSDPFQTFTVLATTTTSGALSFQNTTGSGDNQGALLDNVRVTAVPEPATLAVFAFGAFGAGLYTRRRKVATA